MSLLTSAQVEQFRDEGYLVVEDVLDPERDIQPIMDEYAVLLDRAAAALYADGIVESPHTELPFKERLIQLSLESGHNIPAAFDMSLPQKNIRHDTPIHLGPAVFRALSHPRMLDLVEDIIGPEIYSHPLQHLRTKLPPRALSRIPKEQRDGTISRVPWHQDIAVLLEDAEETDLLTVWVALNDATVENGCLAVIPGSHRGDLLTHCPTPEGNSIPEAVLPPESIIPVPIRAGSVLLIAPLLVHTSLDNVTEDDVRFSFDLRYQPTGQPNGRPAFPGFVVRSKEQPETVLRDPSAWAQTWYDARARLAEEGDHVFSRWEGGESVCG